MVLTAAMGFPASRRIQLLQPDTACTLNIYGLCVADPLKMRSSLMVLTSAMLSPAGVCDLPQSTASADLVTACSMFTLLKDILDMRRPEMSTLGTSGTALQDH